MTVSRKASPPLGMGLADVTSGRAASERLENAKRGIPPIRSDTYKLACQEGWVPEPTNDVQRTIWKQVHSIPDKPITIEFDPKKDK